MSEFLQGFTFGSLAGGGAKYFFDRVIKYHDAKIANRKKMVVSEIDDLLKRTDSLVSLALEYYGQPANDAKKVSVKIKSDLKSFSVKWSVISNQLNELGMKKLPDETMTGFRRALTLRLDDGSRTEPLNAGDSTIDSITTSMANIFRKLSDTKFDLS